MAAAEGCHDGEIGGNIGVIKFLDGRVKHGHDKGNYAAFRFFTRSCAGMTAEPFTASLPPGERMYDRRQASSATGPHQPGR